MIASIKLALHMIARWWFIRQSDNLLTDGQIKLLRGQLDTIDKAIDRNLKDEIDHMRRGFNILARDDVRHSKVLYKRRRKVLNRLASDERLMERIEMYI